MDLNIHSIESLSTVDGPGIRYVVFTQGCSLRCKYCHNPDTWSCGANKLMDIKELETRIIRSKEFLIRSDGGVTFSGGEPLLQIDSLIEICKNLKKENIHIAIDTSGDFDVDEKVKELCKYVDLFLLDIKHVNGKMHKWLTGKDNDKTRKFADYVCNIACVPTIIRVVYLPGITDKDNYLNELKYYIRKLSSVEKSEVLPYHEMGKYKWEELKIPYPLNDMKVPTKEEAIEIEKFLNEK